MKYKAYKLKFLTAVHFGEGTLDNTSYVFYADTLFSALCMEAVNRGQERLDTFVNMVKEDKLIFSDAMPYMDEDIYYIPKPMCDVKYGVEQIGDSSLKKLYKSMDYIAVADIDQFVNGEFSESLAKEFDSFGKRYIKVSAFVNGNEDTVPYRVGEYYYNEGNGLYIVVGYENEDNLKVFEDLLRSLGYSGIGGKRSAGLGRFEISVAQDADELLSMIGKEADEYITLSVSLPKESELERVLDDSKYKIIKRSGFVVSNEYKDRQKRDMYVIAAGSCVKNKYNGDVYNVGGFEGHPVYRYAKPMFMEVRV